VILALDTGWKPREIVRLPAAFRSACHWAVFVRAVAGPGGLQHIDIPKGASPEYRLDAARVNANRGKLRSLLFPADE